MLAACVALLAACDGYPSGWAGISGRVLGFSTGCPDLTGTYRLSPAREGGRALSQSLIGRTTANARRPRWKWETVTIDGDARDSLVLTLRRSPEMQTAYRDSMFAQGNEWERTRRRMLDPLSRWRGSLGEMDDSAYAANLRKLTIAGKQREVVVRGQHYECDGGWLVADRLVHDPGPDPSRPRPDTVIGTVSLARDRDARLVFHGEYPEAMSFSIWCGDGCHGIPLGTWTQHDWGRLDSATAPPDLVEATPWAGPFAPDSTMRIWSNPPTQSAAEVALLLQPVLGGPVSLDGMVRDGSRYRATLRSTAGVAPFHETLKQLRGQQAISSYQVVGFHADSGVPRLLLEIGVVSRRSVTAPSAIEAKVRGRLPAGATIDAVRQMGPAFHVLVTFPSQRAYLDLLNALRNDPTIEWPEVIEAGKVGEQVRATLRIREKVVP